MFKQKLHGCVRTHNQEKGFGTIEGIDKKKYFYFEEESKSFNFKMFNGKPVAVTFTAWPSRKPGGLPLARNVECDKEFYERKAKEKYGAKYHTPESRRAFRAAQFAAKNSTVPVSH
jgi:hypothetical protein